ncbi:TPA: GNAT family N-acetyltransferase [Enterobacter cancerogenus]
MAFVAIFGDEIVGTASLVEYEGSYTSLRPWVSGVFVPERWRGQGIAKELISAIEAEAQKLGCFCLWLSASVPDMYLKLGYTFSELYKGEEPVMFKYI